MDGYIGQTGLVLSDVTRSIQVQRGLGASKLALPSLGGTINMMTKTSDMEKGGNAYLYILEMIISLRYGTNTYLLAKMKMVGRVLLLLA
jgi:outer membrane receptor protein involved in Fe transport